MILKKHGTIKYIIREPINNYNEISNVFLLIHGYGSNEKDLFNTFAKDIPESFTVISIRGFYCIEYDKYYWYDIDFSDKKKIIHIGQAKETIKKISVFINEYIYNLKNTIVWLCGFSQGAILSYSLALYNPKIIKKVILLSGYLENKIILEKNINYDYSFFRNIDFFISHGKYDTIIPIEWAKKGIKFLKKNRIYSIYYKEYESGHVLCNLNYKDTIDWIKINKTK